MQVGVFLGCNNFGDWERVFAGEYSRPPGRPDYELVEELMEIGDMVEPLGFDSLWAPEHYGSPYSLNGNPLQWLTYFAGRTERIDMGTAVIVAPWWEPIRLSHELALLDILLKGRRIHIGIGRGVSAHEFANFGVPREEARTRFKEIIETLQLSDTREEYAYDGEAVSVPPTSVRPQARHRGSLFANMKGAFNTPQSMQIAAELGLGQMFVTGESMDSMSAQVAKFNAIRSSNGLEPNQPTCLLYLHCASDAREIDEGHRYVREQGQAARFHYASWKGTDFSTTKGYEDYARFFTSAPQSDPSIGVESVVSTAELVGTPEQLFDQIQALQEAISLEHLVLHPLHGTKPASEALKSLKLFAAEVLPAVQALATPLRDHSRGSAESLATSGAIGSAVGR
jgi:alkanesulfonate monooxygenase SsuD/methylene tetrahydromethanopterin reductase-like flavin-dependent oxidoreductase (luciferase family)